MTPDQALNLLAQVAWKTPLTGDDRNMANTAIQVLAKYINTPKPVEEKVSEKG
jgi:hypothetical protein